MNEMCLVQYQFVVQVIVSDKLTYGPSFILAMEEVLSMQLNHSCVYDSGSVICRDFHLYGSSATFNKLDPEAVDIGRGDLVPNISEKKHF